MLLSLSTLERQCECVEKRRGSPGVATEMSEHIHSSFLFTKTIKGFHKSRDVKLSLFLLSWVFNLIVIFQGLIWFPLSIILLELSMVLFIAEEDVWDEARAYDGQGWGKYMTSHPFPTKFSKICPSIHPSIHVSTQPSIHHYSFIHSSF